MARGRFISKAISLDEKVNSLSDDTARLLFTWLITHLDCEGRSHGDAMTVKSIVFPRRKIAVSKVEKYLQELHKKRLVFRYSVNGNDYLCMKNFEKHQPGLQKSKEAQSQIPTSTPELLWNSSRATPPKDKEQVKDKDKGEDKVETKGSSCNDSSLLNILKSYEENIAPLSAVIRDEIEAAFLEYDAAWVMDAIKEAVMHNKLTWAYIKGILRNWKESGR